MSNQLPRGWFEVILKYDCGRHGGLRASAAVASFYDKFTLNAQVSSLVAVLEKNFALLRLGTPSSGWSAQISR
jgi:hypothetical protein